MLSAISICERSQIDHVLGSLPSAAKIVELGCKAHAAKTLDASFLGCVQDVRDDMMRYLALFRDTWWIGWADAEDLDTMAEIEDAASTLLKACGRA